MPQLHYEFDKNADSIYVVVVTPISRKVSLATIGVCVFYALTSVGAFFILGEIEMKNLRILAMLMVLCLTLFTLVGCSFDETEIQQTEKQAESTVMVWIPSTGSKYHANPKCSNMKSPTRVSIESAKAQGYEACKNCY